MLLPIKYLLFGCISMVVAMDKPSLADLTSGLPQDFLLTEVDLTVDGMSGNQDILSNVRYNYFSENPVRKTNRGGIFLKADLEYTQYKSKQQARVVMQEFQHLAHPDTGLSYAWDYLLLAGDSIYHLHASCVFSADGFKQIMNNLDEYVALSGKQYAAKIRCRCGGGCEFEGSRSARNE